MLHSTFTSAVARGGSSGGSDYSREFFNFPMTIASEPPSNPSQGVREGHVWLVMTQDQKNTLHNIVFDAYSQTVVYQPGTLVIIVPRFGNNRVYVNQTKNTGDSTTPLVYSTSDDLETLWPVTVVSDNKIQVKMEISKPWQYAKLITPSSFDNIPLYYFNGNAWEAPRTWDYIYWSNMSDGTVWQAYQMNTETFTPIKENMLDFDLNPIVKTVLASENKTVQPSISVISKGGFAVLGLKNVHIDNNIKGGSQSDVVQWWQYQPEWYFLKINKRGVSYLGRCNLTPYPDEKPYIAVAVKNSMDNQVDYDATDFCVFLQTAVTENDLLPSYLYFRRYYFDESSGTMKYTDTNKVALNRGIIGATFDFNSRDSGFIAYHVGIGKSDKVSMSNNSLNIATFSIKDNVLTIGAPLVSVVTNIYSWPMSNSFSLNVFEDFIHITLAASTATTGKSSFLYTRQRNGSLLSYHSSVNSGGFGCVLAYYKYDRTEFIFNNSSQYLRYAINRTNPNNYTFTQIEVTTNAPPSYQKDFFYPSYEKQLPGPRDDKFIWQPANLSKQNPANLNQVLPIDQIGVTGMVTKSQCGSGVNMAIASLLKP